MKWPTWILSLFGRAITKCDFCPSTFRGSTGAGYIWFGHHVRVCPRATIAFRTMRIDDMTEVLVQNDLKSALSKE